MIIDFSGCTVHIKKNFVCMNIYTQFIMQIVAQNISLQLSSSN